MPTSRPTFGDVTRPIYGTSRNPQGDDMRVRSVICSVGRSGYMHRDLMAMKSGAKQDGFIFHGKAVSPGFKKIVEPATIVSVMVELEDGQIALCDCADVILAVVAGHGPAFYGEDHHYEL